MLAFQAILFGGNMETLEINCGQLFFWLIRKNEANQYYFAITNCAHYSALWLWWQFCITFVRPFDAGVNILQMRALSHALGIPLCLKLVDETENNGTAQVTCFDFLPQLESGVSRTSDPLSSIRSYYLSSTTDKHPEQGRDMPSGNLSNRMPLVTLLVMNGDYAILYRKWTDSEYAQPLVDGPNSNCLGDNMDIYSVYSSMHIWLCFCFQIVSGYTPLPRQKNTPFAGMRWGRVFEINLDLA